jgi:hypothetical protein
MPPIRESTSFSCWTPKARRWREYYDKRDWQDKRPRVAKLSGT